MSTLAVAARRFPRGLALALAVGAVLRAWYLASLVRQPFFGHLLVDSRAYDASAMAILAGRGFEGTLYRPPLYPLFLAAVYAVSARSAAAVAAAQMLLGLLSVIAVFLLARRWYGERAGTLAALVAAAYPLRIYYEGELLDTTLFCFLLLAAAFASVEGIARRSAPLLAATGALLGASALARPNVLAVVPFLALGGWLLLRDNARGGLPRAGLVGGVALMLFAIAPAAIHNWRSEGHLVPVAAFGGINFFLGNAPGATGETPLAPGLVWEETVLMPVREGIGGRAAQDAWWWRRGWAQVAERPLGILSLLARKTLLFFNLRESSNNKALSFFTAVSPVTAGFRWWFGPLAAFALSTLPLTLRAGGTGFLVCLIAGVAASVVPFFVTARYRLPAVPFLAILAAGGAVALMRRLRAGTLRFRPAPSAWAAICGLAVLVPWFGLVDDAVDPDLQMAQIRIERGEPAFALAHLSAAAVRRPDDPNVHNIMGVAKAALSDPAGAQAAYRRALALGEFSTVHFNLGVLRHRAGDAPGAALEYRRALELNPLHPGARRNLALLGSAPDARAPATASAAP